MRLRDFNWREDQLIKSRSELTTRKVHPSTRGKLQRQRFPSYNQTRDFFSDSYKEILAISSSITQKIRQEDQERLERERREKEQRQDPNEPLDEEARRKALDEEGRHQMEIDKDNDGPVMIYNRDNPNNPQKDK